MAITFELSTDPKLLAQYYTLRETCFRKELGLPDFDGAEDEQDRESMILVAHDKGRCLGGVRISPRPAAQLSLQKLHLKPESCCMWERLVIEPSARSVKLLRAFCSHMIALSQSCGYQHALILSSLRNARFYRQCHSALGVQFQIHHRVPHCARGAFAGLEHFLSVANLNDELALQMAA